MHKKQMNRICRGSNSTERTFVVPKLPLQELRVYTYCKSMFMDWLVSDWLLFDVCGDVERRQVTSV